MDLESGRAATSNQTCELSDAVAELMIDKTVGILAGDTENITQYQRAETTLAQNS